MTKKCTTKKLLLSKETLKALISNEDLRDVVGVGSWTAPAIAQCAHTSIV